MRDRILEVLKLNRNNGVTIEQIYKQIFHTEVEDKLYQNLCDELLRKNQNKINSDELKEYFNEIYKVKNMIEQYED